VYNIFHRLKPEELEEAVIEYLTRIQRHDLVTRMKNNKQHFSITRDGELLCEALVSSPKTSEQI